MGGFQICFHFQFPLLLNHLRATENKLLSSADLGFLASIVCSLLTLASDHFHPCPPPKGRHTPRIAAGKGGCRGCGQSSHSEPPACVRQLLLPSLGGGVVSGHKPRAPVLDPKVLPGFKHKRISISFSFYIKTRLVPEKWHIPTALPHPLRIADYSTQVYSLGSDVALGCSQPSTPLMALCPSMSCAYQVQP